MSGLVQPTLTGGPLASPETFGGGNGFNKHCGDCTTHNQAGDPVDTATGNFWETFTDLAVPGRGVPMLVSRTYNSQSAGTDGLFGFGWSWTYGTNLRVTSRESGTLRPLGVTVHQGNGATATFTRPNSSSAFSAPPRVDGSVVHDPSTDTYSVKRGPSETLTFDGGGRLTGIRDPNGYLTTLAWSATQLVVTEPAPGLRQLRFTLAADASGRSRVTQWSTRPAGG